MSDIVSVPTFTVDQYNAVVRRLRLRHLEVTRLSAQKLAPGPSPETNYQISSTYVQDVENSVLYYRFEVGAQLLGRSDDDVVATVEGTVVAVYEVRDGTDEIPPDICEAYGTMSVPFVVHPYLRELVSSTAARLGFFGVTMPTIVIPSDDEPDPEEPQA
jgi:preprotein translocase subunit SecB